MVYLVKLKILMLEKNRLFIIVEVFVDVKLVLGFVFVLDVVVELEIIKCLSFILLE